MCDGTGVRQREDEECNEEGGARNDREEMRVAEDEGEAEVEEHNMQGACVHAACGTPR